MQHIISKRNIYLIVLLLTTVNSLSLSHSLSLIVELQEAHLMSL